MTNYMIEFILKKLVKLSSNLDKEKTAKTVFVYYIFQYSIFVRRLCFFGFAVYLAAFSKF